MLLVCRQKHGLESFVVQSPRFELFLATGGLQAVDGDLAEMLGELEADELLAAI